MPEHIRTFIAIDVAANPLRDVLDALCHMGRPVRALAEPLHLTLKFLGDTDVGSVPEISRIIDEVAQEHAAFDLDLRGLGAFPKIERPSIVWAGVTPPEQVTALAEDLALRLEPLGFPIESRPFHPHVTLARVKARPPRELAALLEMHVESPFGVARVSELRYYQSELTSRGSQYSVLSTAPLREH